VKVLRYVAVDDVGNVISPMIVDGMVHGGVAQGIGQALWEGAVYDDDSGQLVVLNKDPYQQHVIEALTWLKETYTDPKWAKMVPHGINAWTDPSNNEAYPAGKIFFTGNVGTMFAKAIFDKNPVADDTYLILPPKGVGPDGRSLPSAGISKRWFVVKGAKNREAAEQPGQRWSVGVVGVVGVVDVR